MKIKIAQIGYGYWGKRLYKYLKTHKGLDLKYVSALNVKNKGIFTKDINKIWQDKNIKAVVIATPIETHYKIAKKALLSNKHVFSEKPLSPKTKEILELKKIAQKNNLLLLTEFTYTFSKSLEKAKEIIKKGTIGKIESIEMSLKYAGRFLKFDVFWLFGSHLLSILDIFTPLEKLKFRKFDLIKRKNKTETGVIFFKGKNISGQMIMSQNYPEKKMEVIIYGSKGTLIYSSMTEPSLKYICYKKTPATLGNELITKEKSFNIDEKNNLKYAVDYFYKALNKKEKTNIKRALLVTKILEKL